MTTTRKRAGILAATVSAMALSLATGLVALPQAKADPAQARNLLKAMSDYLAAQNAISFSYDTNLEVVTTEGQNLAVASSGEVILNRPNKLRAMRHGGFADVETVFDGNTLTVLGKNVNMYTQIDVPGTIDHLVDELRDTYNSRFPAPI
jgi:hypothetical protein